MSAPDATGVPAIHRRGWIRGRRPLPVAVKWPVRMLRRLRYVPRPEATAAALSVGVSVVLLVLKFVAYYKTGSAAIFSDALESIVNVVASLVAAWSLYLAHQPADEQHPYGHGKAEFLSAGFEGGMILIAALVIIERAVEEMIQGPRVHQ